MLHIWNIYPHLAQIFHTWSLWVIVQLMIRQLAIFEPFKISNSTQIIFWGSPQSTRSKFVALHPGCRMNLWDNSVRLAFLLYQMIFAVCEHLAFHTEASRNRIPQWIWLGMASQCNAGENMGLVCRYGSTKAAAMWLQGHFLRFSQLRGA